MLMSTHHYSAVRMASNEMAKIPWKHKPSKNNESTTLVQYPSLTSQARESCCSRCQVSGCAHSLLP